MKQCLAVARKGRHGRDLRVHELLQKAMLFCDRGVRPAVGTVEFDRPRDVLGLDLVDAVFVTGERLKTPCGGKTDGLGGAQDEFRRKVGIGGGGGHVAIVWHNLV